MRRKEDEYFGFDCCHTKYFDSKSSVSDCAQASSFELQVCTIGKADERKSVRKCESGAVENQGQLRIKGSRELEAVENQRQTNYGTQESADALESAHTVCTQESAHARKIENILDV
jgi:hypothetical protein